MQQKILYLLNPSANENNAGKEWAKARKKYSTLPENPVNILEIGNLSGFIKEQDPELIVIAGGDGSVNKVSAAVLQLRKKPLMVVMPFGYGNAMAYTFGIDSIEKAIHVIATRPQQVTIDLLKTNIPDYPIGTFNVSVGFDAKIVHSRMNDRYIGFRSYIISAMRTLVFHPENKMMFTIDHSVELHATASSLVIANSPVIGLNFLIADYARMNDANLDCTVFSTKVAFLTNMRLRGIKHPLYSDKGKLQFKAKHIRVDGGPFVQIDGDPVVVKAPLEVEILPSSVTFLAADDNKLPYTSFVRE
jgi:diacylglycerol kinase family enzyme